MKTISQILVTIGLVATTTLAANTTGPAPEIVIALSPLQPPEVRTNQEALVQRFLVRDRPTTTHVTIWDGWNLKVICDIPSTQLAYDSPAARVQRLAPALASLHHWFANTGGDTAAGLKDSGAIRVPEWLSAVSLKPATGGRLVVICASPFVLAPDEPSFAMLRTAYPSDAHLARPSAESVYGTADKHGTMSGTTVLWAYNSENVWASQHHRERVTRWWSLFIASQGPNAMLAAFNSDASQIFQEALRTNHRPVGEFAVNPNDSTLVMHLATEREVPTDLPPVKPTLSPTPSPPPVAQPVQVMVPKPAQLPPSQPKARPVPVLPPATITLDVGVTDSSRTPIGGLAKSDFVITEDDVPQSITSFSSDRSPISLVVLLDASGSIASKLARIRAAASTIIGQCSGQDEFCIMSFTTDAVVLQDFTQDTALAGNALRNIKAGGGTALLDSIGTALDYAMRHGRHERKGIVLVTDGGETDSRTSRDTVISLLQQANLQFYAVGFPEGLGQGQSPDTRARNMTSKQPTEVAARDLLDTLANASSGGLVFYPRNDGALAQIANSIVSDLRAPRYSLSYQPRRPQSETGWRSIKVLVQESPERGPLTARTRAGYFAGQQTGTPSSGDNATTQTTGP